MIFTRLRYLIMGGQRKMRKFYHSPIYLRLAAIGR